MAATKTVPQRAELRKFADLTISKIEPRHGVVTLFGYGIKVRVDRGHLILEDGIGEDRREGRFARVRHGLERLIVIGADGMVSLAALRWLACQDVAFVMLERDGTVLATTGPIRPSDARLRRAQARADDSGAAVVITRELITRKLTGQERLARESLRNASAADTIAGFRAQLSTAKTIEHIRLLEARAAQAYWLLWHDLPVSFPRSEMPRVPGHWRTFDVRKSPITGSPQRAANPQNAILNYLYTILAAEARLAAAAMGLDPGLGFLHSDKDNRDSLACDLMEPVRPDVDNFVLDWISRTPLKRDWFFEQRDGTCRLMAPLVARLAETAPTWRNAVAPLAEWVARTLWSTIRSSERNTPLATRLTQRHKRQAQGSTPIPPTKPAQPPESVCRICGTAIRSRRSYCSNCAPSAATEEIVQAAKIGWTAAHTPKAEALRAETQRRHAAAQADWRPESLPAWLTEETYTQELQPLLARTPTSAIASTIGVSWAYASRIHRGVSRPHPRHWLKLAELVGHLDA